MNNVISAEIVGSVMQVAVAEGASVVAGDTVVVLESMKMEIPVLTEVAGTVRELGVQAGDIVQEGDLIAVIEETGE